MCFTHVCNKDLERPTTCSHSWTPSNGVYIRSWGSVHQEDLCFDMELTEKNSLVGVVKPCFKVAKNNNVMGHEL